MQLIFAQIRRTGRHEPMPEVLIQAYQRHVGRDWYNQPTGREPTKELCTFCYYYIRSWVRSAQPTSALVLDTDSDSD